MFINLTHLCLNSEFCPEVFLPSVSLVPSFSFSIDSSVDRHLGCFHVLAIANSAAVNTGVPVSFSIMVFSGYMSSSGTVGSLGSFIPSFLHRDCLF